jgi:hypothetical protein
MDAESSNQSISNSNTQDAQAPAEQSSSVLMKTSPPEMEVESNTPQPIPTSEASAADTPKPFASAAGIPPLAHPTPGGMSATAVPPYLSRPRSAASNSSDSARSSSLPPSSQPNSPRQKITGFASIKQRLEGGGGGAGPGGSFGSTPSGIPMQYETPAEPPPETPAALSETPRPIHPPTTPLPVRQLELPPRHSSEPPQSQHSDGDLDDVIIKREAMEGDLTPQNSGLSHRTGITPGPHHLIKPRQQSVPLSSHEPPRRTTRGSIAAAAAAAHEQQLAPPKRTIPQPGEPVQASINQWILTQDKNWVLPPPAIGVSLAQICPSDVEIKPWMKFTRHPIVWDGMTDAGTLNKNVVLMIVY